MKLVRKKMMLATSTLFNVNNILNELQFCQTVNKIKKYSNSKKSLKTPLYLLINVTLCKNSKIFLTATFS